MGDCQNCKGLDCQKEKLDDASTAYRCSACGHTWSEQPAKPSSGDAWLTDEQIEAARGWMMAKADDPGRGSVVDAICNQALAAIKAKGPDPQREALVEVADAARRFGDCQDTEGLSWYRYYFEAALRRLDASEGL